MNNKEAFVSKLKTAVTLLLYIGITLAVYAIAAHFMNRPFEELEFMYSVLIGLVAYLPMFIFKRKQLKKKG